MLNRYAYKLHWIKYETRWNQIQKILCIDQKVRRAMAYLTPIDEIIEVMKCMEKQIDKQLKYLPLKSTYNDTLKLIPFDIEKAKELLLEVGWVDTDGDNIRDKIIDGVKTPFSFKLSYMSSPITKEIVLMIIQESMYKAGFICRTNTYGFYFILYEMQWTMSLMLC